MRKQQYVVKLNGKERSRLEDLIRKGKSSARVQLRARILLHADINKKGSAWNDVQISEALGTYPIMCARVRRQFADRRREGSKTNCAGLLTAARRTLGLDAAAAGGQNCGTEDCQSCQRQHDWTGFKKNQLKPHLKEQWVIPPEKNSAFVAAMEDVLAVYMRPHDADFPLVCFDEASKQLIANTREPIPMKPGQPVRVDYEYERL